MTWFLKRFQIVGQIRKKSVQFRLIERISLLTIFSYKLMPCLSRYLCKFPDFWGFEPHWTLCMLIFTMQTNRTKTKTALFIFVISVRFNNIQNHLTIYFKNAYMCVFSFFGPHILVLRQVFFFIYNHIRNF